MIGNVLMSSFINMNNNNKYRRKKIIRISTVPISLTVLLKGQLKMLSRDYDIIGVSSPGYELKILAEQEGIRIVALPMERKISLIKDLVSLIRLVILFFKEKPDMVHSITPKAGLLAMLAAWMVRVPVRMHTFTGLVFPTATGNMQRLLILIDRLICFCATHINPEGEGVKRDLQRFKITSKPLEILANGNVNGIDLDYYSRSSEVMKQALTLRKRNCFTFCFIGRIVKDKGINELIHAFLHLYQDNDKISLLLVGVLEKQDPVLPEVEWQILHHPGIRFVGWQDDVRPFLAISDVLAFPSYREGFPNVVLQAGALNLPSIVSDINGCNEIIIPYENGLIIPAQDENALYSAMACLLSHIDEVKIMANNARPLVAIRYEQGIVWKALREKYASLLG